jgi:hypothetical protein
MQAVHNLQGEAHIPPSAGAAIMVVVQNLQSVILVILCYSPPLAFPRPPHLPSGFESCQELPSSRGAVMSLPDTKQRMWFFQILSVSHMAAVLTFALDLGKSSEGEAQEIVQAFFMVLWAACSILLLAGNL